LKKKKLFIRHLNYFSVSAIFNLRKSLTKEHDDSTSDKKSLPLPCSSAFELVFDILEISSFFVSKVKPTIFSHASLHSFLIDEFSLDIFDLRALMRLYILCLLEDLFDKTF
jgi:hypothetical protein